MQSLHALIAAALLSAPFAASLPRAARAETPAAVGYVTKSATNQGWVLINRGAADAAKDAHVRLIVGGPSSQGELAGQIEAIGRVISEGAKAVALAPVDWRGSYPSYNGRAQRAFRSLQSIPPSAASRPLATWRPTTSRPRRRRPNGSRPGSEKRTR